MKGTIREDSYKEASPAHSIRDADSRGEKDFLEIDAQEEKRAVRKLDYALIPLMTMFYLLSFLVRSASLQLRIAHLFKLRVFAIGSCQYR